MIDAADGGVADFLRAEIAAAVRDSLGGQLAELHRFVDRRFAELSAEIHASVTITEMSEAALAGQIGRTAGGGADGLRANRWDAQRVRT